ncbi:MerR family transcriptional regulator [Gorillibacterium sp. CAU 1737]|uniref:MerR family transcriptional regulator n=1 Tax=Gorillibacterium sp. CAU 1737 TaxID=3140362 RepID=UPI0032612345
MRTYRTSQVAKKIQVHPNTVRLYEELGLIPKPERRANGYRVFTDFHVEQIRLVRMALKVEVLQSGLRKHAISISKTAAAGKFDEAIRLTESYLQQIRKEQRNAEEALGIAERLLAGEPQEGGAAVFTRKEAADSLQVTMDALRNWEMNGLITLKRRLNGYRVYTDPDMQRLKIIRSLRCANYSLSAILRMLIASSANPDANIRQVIDTPKEGDDIISVCDQLLTSLREAEENAKAMLVQLENMVEQFAPNPQVGY